MFCFVHAFWLRIVFVALLGASLAQANAQPVAPAFEESVAIPTASYKLDLRRLAQGKEFKLYGIQNRQQLEFTLRRDQLVTQARLHLVFTPSPVLLPKLSHLLVYLNDELMGVVPVDNASTGQQQERSIGLDTGLLRSFNTVRLEFVGHYTDVCENLAHSSLWLDISKSTHIAINSQAMAIANDLSYFPEPFLDTHDMSTQALPFVFAGAPNTEKLQAAAILASYFGMRAQWRELSFPVSYGALPSGHAVIFAVNGARPEFLADYPAVDGPTVDMISAQNNPYQKLLLILGRDDQDLKTAVSALALDASLFRGQSVRIDEVAALAPRKPYDAPNWIPTDRPVKFSELIEYPNQLEVQGLRPSPIAVNLSLPPDLFVWRNNGIPMQIRYRYTAPKVSDESRLTLSLNDRFVDSYLLESSGQESALARMRLPVLANDPVGTSESLVIPALRIGTHNQLRFDFTFASTVGASKRDMCQTTLPIDARAAVDENSVIDFSGYEHYLEMPNLRAFAGSGFPFSRMADLSETVVVMPVEPNPGEVSALLEVLAHIGSQVGYPAWKITVLDDWERALGLDADVLWIGKSPDAFRTRPDANLILQDAMASLRRPRKRMGVEASSIRTEYSARQAQDATSEVRVRALAPMAAVVQMQSPNFPQRSMVGLLASTDEDLSLLRQALRDSGKREAIMGSVSIIRASGVASEMVGPTYFVGNLHWWQLVWFHLSDKPILLGGIAALAVLLIAILLWSTLRWVARRRLSKDA